MAEITLAELQLRLQRVAEHYALSPKDILVSIDGYSDERIKVRTVTKGRNRAESDHNKLRIVLDIET